MLAVTEHRSRQVGAFGKTDAGQRRARRVAQRRILAGVAPEPERVAGMGLNRQRDIVERAEIEKQRRDLE